ncbi:MAG: hypothetical protein GTN69_03430 [Armatimonadetes bacterium]|nr:hypothetical protein [Armatimonadota bacterium]
MPAKTCGRCRHCRWQRDDFVTGTCYLTRKAVQTAADASQCHDYTEPIIAPEDIERGCYGDDEGRVYVVTSACERVNWLVIGTSCTFEGCLRMDPSGQYRGPAPREALAVRITKRLETPELPWRKVE